MTQISDADLGVAVVGGGPSGMTTALLLARAGHRVTLFDSAGELGGLWSSKLDENGHFRGDNSCKVYQSSYHSAPHLFRLIGTDWQRHFKGEFDLTSDWLRPFAAACTWRDVAVLGGAYLQHLSGMGKTHRISVADFMAAQDLSEGCRNWLRATALGGIAGTLRMTMWELFHRMGSNVHELLRGTKGPLFWNAQPPNSASGFVPIWRRALERHGVVHRANTRIASLTSQGGTSVRLTTETGKRHNADAVFLALPPPALAGLMRGSQGAISNGFGLSGRSLQDFLGESVYEHLGISWYFDRDLPKDLPLGGNNVRRGWHPILVQHAQYREQLRKPARTVVVGSIALDTEFRHHRLGTLAREHSHEELAAILWEDERRADPTLPEPIDMVISGSSSATQIVHRGPLPIKMRNEPVYLATNLHGLAPYFTASLESAIQSGAIAAEHFDPAVERLPMGPTRRTKLPWSEGDGWGAPTNPLVDWPTAVPDAAS